MQEVPANSCAIFQPEIEAMGGSERSLVALSYWLWKWNIPNHLLTYADHIGIAKYVEHPITVVELRPELRATKKAQALKRYFGDRPKKPAPLMSGYQAAMHAALAGIKGTHCLMHDTPDLFSDAARMSAQKKARRWISNRVAAHGLRSGGRTIVTSEHLRDECRRLFGVNADIARMGGLADAAAFRLRPVEGHLRMLSVSRLEANKRIDWILRALAAMEQNATPLSSRVDWKLQIAGTGSLMGTLQEMTKTLGIEKRVEFPGYVSDATLQQLYAEAHLFLMPAVQGYGIPAVEALARGLPVLLHRESGVSDILLDTKWATVIDGGEEGMLPGLRAAIDGVVLGEQLSQPLPALPTEEEWARCVSTLCGWV
jgi:glycosyltransferase involved in cell wall biosynthesis